MTATDRHRVTPNSRASLFCRGGVTVRIRDGPLLAVCFDPKPWDTPTRTHKGKYPTGHRSRCARKLSDICHFRPLFWGEFTDGVALRVIGPQKTFAGPVPGPQVGSTFSVFSYRNSKTATGGGNWDTPARNGLARIPCSCRGFFGLGGWTASEHSRTRQSRIPVVGRANSAGQRAWRVEPK